MVYFPWDIDRLVLGSALRRTTASCCAMRCDWAANEPPPVTVTGPGVLDVTVWRQKASMTVHLVNLTNPMAMRPNARQLIPSPPQHVVVRLPKGAKAARVRLLVAGRDVPVGQTGGPVRLTIPSVLDHEVIAIDLA